MLVIDLHYINAATVLFSSQNSIFSSHLSMMTLKNGLPEQISILHDDRDDSDGGNPVGTKAVKFPSPTRNSLGFPSSTQPK